VERLRKPGVPKRKRSLGIEAKGKPKTPIWTVTMLKKQRKRLMALRDASLMLAMFFLPFGYDFLFKLIMEATGSFWKADLIFYGISASFFASYILLSKHLNKSS